MEQKVLRGPTKQEGVAQAERALLSALLLHTHLHTAAQEAEKALFVDKNASPKVRYSGIGPILQ
jgi:hypothetical protein